MNAGAKIAKGEILLFLHADTFLPKNALDEISDIVQNDIVAGAFDLAFDNEKFSLKVISTIASYRSRITRTPYGDQAIFIKKVIFNKVAQYETISLMEDVNLMQKLKKHNYKIHILNSKVVTSSRKWEQSGIVYTTLRNWILIVLYYFGVDPERLSKFYH